MAGHAPPLQLGVNGMRAGAQPHLVVVTSSSFSCGVWWPGVRQQAALPQRLPLGLRWRQRRTEEGERGGRKRERARFDRGKLKIFELNLKSFEFQSCSSCHNLQLWFQMFSHLRLGLKFKNSNSSLNENPLNLLFFGFFSKFHVVT